MCRGNSRYEPDPRPRRSLLPPRAAWLCSAICGLLSLLLAVPAVAQLAGSLVGRVTDKEGTILPDVGITLSGHGDQPWETRSNLKGEFRLRELPPGDYAIEAHHDSFTTAIYEPVQVRGGRTTNVRIVMSTMIEETITVTSEPPPVVVGNPRAVLHIEGSEIESISAASDPWAMLEHAPRVVGEGESASSTFTLGGAGLHENLLTLDGAPVSSDLSSGRATPMDLEGLRRVEVLSGSADASIAQSGLLLNLVTKAGENRARGSFETHFADDAWQSSPSVPSANRLLQASELFGDLSGKLVEDRLWAWGSHGSQDIRRQAFGGQQASSQLHHLAAKLSAQPDRRSSAVLAYYRSDHESFGLGAGPARSLETTQLEDEPSDFLKLDLSRAFGDRIYLTGRYSSLESGRVRSPLNGFEDDVELGDDGIWRGSYFGLESLQDETHMHLEAHGSGRPAGRYHEISLGFDIREVGEQSREQWGARNLIQLAAITLGSPFDIVRVLRPQQLSLTRRHAAMWIQDGIEFGNLRLDVGLRHDYQSGRNLELDVAGNPLLPDLLPGVEFAGGATVARWKSMAPRLALAYAFGREGRTVLRAGYANFDGQLFSDLIGRQSPGTRAELYLRFDDLNGDRRFDSFEQRELLDWNGIDPTQATANLSPHRIDPILRPEQTHERRIGLEHQPRPDLTLSVDVFKRRISGILETRPLVRGRDGSVREVTYLDYLTDGSLRGKLPDGSSFTVPLFRLSADLTPTGGNLLKNGDRSQDYSGITFRAHKRLSNRWMLRGHFTWSDWRWRIGNDFLFHDDPTNAALGAGGDAGISNADSPGDIVVPATSTVGGSGALFPNSGWAFNVLALYQIAPDRPWGFELAANLNGREGFPLPYAVSTLTSDQALHQVQVTPRSDSFRLPDVVTLDLRLDKELSVRKKLRVLLSLDATNLLDAEQILDRERQLNTARADSILEAARPRSFRLGLKVEIR